MFSLRSKLLLLVLPSLVAITALIVGYGAYTSYQRSQVHTEAQLQVLAVSYANTVNVEIELALNAARTLAQALSAVHVPGSTLRLTRGDVNTMLHEVLRRNPSFLAVYTAWEPNAFDGKDAAFAGTTGHDSTGRFSPYWSRADGEIRQETNIGYETEGIGDYYLLPKRTRQECIIEPYMYPVQGKEVLMTSLVVPIVVGDEFFGICAVDISLQYLQAISDNADIFDHAGTLAIMSHKGTLVSVSAKPEWQAKPAQTLIPGFSPKRSGQVQKNVRQREVQHVGDTLYAFAAIPIGFTASQWQVCVSVPEQIVMSSIKANTVTQVSIAVVLIGVIIAVAWFFSTRLLHALHALQTATESLAAGGLETFVTIRTDDEVGMVGQSFNQMAFSIRSMMQELIVNNHLLTQAQHELDTMLQKMTIGVAVNKNNRYVFTNEALRRILGYTDEEFKLVENIAMLIHEEDRDIVQTRYEERLLGVRSHSEPAEVRYRHKDGRGMWVQVSGLLITYQGERATLASFVDITERKHAEEQLRRTQENQRIILETMGVAVTVNHEAQFLFVNEAWCRMVGYTREDTRSLKVYDMIHPDSRLFVEGLSHARLRGEQMQGVYTAKVYRKDGDILWVEVSAFKIDYEGVLAVIATFVDITERTIAMHQLEEAVQQQEALLLALEQQKNAALRSFLQGQEEERHRIAQDLHDGVGHLLSIVKIGLSTFQERIGEAEPERMQEFEQCMDLFDKAVREVRAVSHQLMPATLRKMGLQSALRDLATILTLSAQIQVNVVLDALEELDLPDNRLDTQMETSIFRVIQELVNNTLKYAEATTISVQFIKTERSLICIYEDDGNGFAMSESGISSGIGLRNIHNRITLLGGTVEFDSSFGNGMVATIEIPTTS